MGRRADDETEGEEILHNSSKVPTHIEPPQRGSSGSRSCDPISNDRADEHALPRESHLRATEVREDEVQAEVQIATSLHKNADAHKEARERLHMKPVKEWRF